MKLRNWSLDDAESLLYHANNEKIAKHLTNVFPHPYTKQDAQFFIELCQNADAEKQINYAVEVDGKAAGSISVHCQTDVHEKSAELGYWLGEEYWGRGMIPQAVREVCREAFEVFDIVRIQAEVFAENKASQRVLEKAGFVREAVLKKSIYKNGKLQDSHLYALVK
jgi:ribosomal-protein-alanine N-acetyltransferase